MNIEARDLFRTLQNTPPLDQLDKVALARWHEAAEILYFRTGETLLKRGALNEYVWLIRTGSVEVLDADGTLVNLLGEGDWFGYRSVLNQGQVSLTITVREDLLVYRFPASLFLESYRQHAGVRAFFHQHKPARFRQVLPAGRTLQAPDLSLSLLAISTPAPLLSTHDTLQQAAEMLTHADNGMAVVHEPETGHLYRLLEASDVLQTIARGGSPDTSLRHALEKQPPLQLPATLTVGEALTRLLQHGRHAAVLASDDSSTPQVFSLSQLQQTPHPLLGLMEQIQSADSLSQLKAASDRLPELFVTLVRTHTPPRACGELISRIGEALNVRVLQLIRREIELPEEVPFALVSLGSMARHEQTLRSDQDNALILGDYFDEFVHGEAFARFAQQFNTQLAQLGYALCPHEVMARNPDWRQPLHRWLARFRSWIAEPVPEALLNAAIFFDMHLVDGQPALLDHLRQQVTQWSRENGLFLHHMAANALRFRPPIGFFRNFIVETRDNRVHVFDIKKHGIAPITELARVHALTGGLTALNTWDRLQQAAEAGLISQQGYADLRDALDLIMLIRLQHQASQVERQEPPDNLIDPDALSRLEQRHLRDAFSIVREMQQALALRHNL